MRSSFGRASMALCFVGAASCSLGELGMRKMGNPPGTPAMSAPAGNTAPSGVADLAVHLVDAPLDGLAAVNIDLQRITILSENGEAIELGQPAGIFDLLKLQGGVSELIARTDLAVGRYSQLRLELGHSNSLTFADGTVAPLRIPSGSESGLKVNIDMDLTAGPMQEVFVDFDVAESLHAHHNGDQPDLMLRPVLRGVMKKRSGTLLGTLMNALDDQPLPNVEVMAQTRSADGEPVVARRVRTNADGRFALDLLPFGQYVVVAQPVVDGTVYKVKVSEPIHLNAQDMQARYDARVVPASEQGSVRVRISPESKEHQGDLCMLYGGSPDAPVIVSTRVPQVVDYEEFAQLGPVPVGDYYAKCVRRSASGGAMHVADSLVSRVTVSPGENQAAVWF